MTNLDGNWIIGLYNVHYFEDTWLSINQFEYTT